MSKHFCLSEENTLLQILKFFTIRLAGELQITHLLIKQSIILSH